MIKRKRYNLAEIARKLFQNRTKREMPIFTVQGSHIFSMSDDSAANLCNDRILTGRSDNIFAEQSFDCIRGTSNKIYKVNANIEYYGKNNCVNVLSSDGIKDADYYRDLRYFDEFLQDCGF